MTNVERSMENGRTSKREGARTWKGGGHDEGTRAQRRLLLSERVPKAGGRALTEYKRPEWAKIPRIKKLGPGQFELEPNDEESWGLFKDAVRQATGTIDDATGKKLLVQAALPSCHGDPEAFALDCTTALAVIYGIKPRDSIEGMLAAQMVGTHTLAMKFLDRSQLEGQSEDQVSENLNRAAKLLRLFTAQVEALGKYRNKGRQKVTVEHVHVNAGGQAIVGTVEHKPGGGK
jgi:hypothetical protein